MAGLKIAHDKCTECRMCYVVCREININAVVVSPTSQHLLEIDERCIYPKCTDCLMYCPEEGSIVENEHRTLARPATAGSLDEEPKMATTVTFATWIKEGIHATLEMTNKLHKHGAPPS